MRSGTSALFNYVSQHPEICAERKEVRFFNRDDFFQEEPDYRKYHAWFNPKPSHKILGETTPYYLSAKASPKRLYHYNPDMKIITILRNPIDRAYSQWNKHRRDGREFRSFSEVMEDYRIGHRSRTASYVKRGLYARQIRGLWSYFPREQTLILKNEDLRECRDETLDLIFQFLGVSPFFCREFRRRTRSEYESTMSEVDRSFLRDIYEPEVRALQSMLGWDCSHWLTA